MDASKVDPVISLPDDYKEYVWFLLPSQALLKLNHLNVVSFGNLKEISGQIEPKMTQNTIVPRDYNKQTHKFR
jgi:hypothetical protein